MVLSGLVFKEYYVYYKIGLKELKKFIESYFDENGFPINRNFENLLTFVQYFILIKEWIKNAQEIVPEYLENIVEKNLVCLNSVNNPSKKLPLFNGSTDKSLSNFFLYLDKLNYRSKKNLKSVGQVQIVKNKKTNYILTLGNHQITDFQKIISQVLCLSNTQVTRIKL